MNPHSMKKRIMVIDDDPGIRSAIKEILTPKGYFVGAAKNAAEAMELLKACSQSTNYHLLIIDINLPQQDGLDFLRVLREQFQLSIPVLIISGDFDEEKIRESARYAAAGFVVKPFQSQTLLERVERCLGIKQAS